jgi:hypothetical protein
MKFKKEGIEIIKKAIDIKLANFLKEYFLLKRNVASILFNSNYISPYTDYFGIWNDIQVPNTYSHYADIAMETLLLQLKTKMEKITGEKLVETYSYARIYKNGDVLERHRDRESCELSTTLNLGGDKWPIFIQNKNKKEIKITLSPGDMLVYRGCDFDHWREKFTGIDCIQVFLHYNKENSKNQNLYDGRPSLGLPSWFKKIK